ncbi:hypothetical protein RHMOL_Rhmol05G0296400 [Rhododendron molle]|uniref:Uncharacterized protein n=1 Tax=Rhododendron molle TaxID=49168 RepID=A0ACC0NVY5_RHOML|nr:hypothetical protein RHMOL_Rhmol05G0296400 [Rhododendron molle]
MSKPPNGISSSAQTKSLTRRRRRLKVAGGRGGGRGGSGEKGVGGKGEFWQGHGKASDGDDERPMMEMTNGGGHGGGRVRVGHRGGSPTLKTKHQRPGTENRQGRWMGGWERGGEEGRFGGRRRKP